MHLIPNDALQPDLVGMSFSALENQGGSGTITKAPELEALDSAWQEHIQDVCGINLGTADAYPAEASDHLIGRRYAYRKIRAFQARLDDTKPYISPSRR